MSPSAWVALGVLFVAAFVAVLALFDRGERWYLRHDWEPVDRKRMQDALRAKDEGEEQDGVTWPLDAA